LAISIENAREMFK